jgi:hypothetical protein
MSYALVATFLKREECEKIQSKAVHVSLTKCGFSRKISRAIVFGSPWFGGLGWHHLFFYQGIQHILLLIKHIRTPGHFQSLLLICLHWYQVVASISFCPFARPHVKMPYLGSSWWLDSTRVFLAYSSATLHIAQAPIPSLQRQHDACIMDGVIELGLPATSLERINCCRLYLHVTTLSDICTLHSDQIERKAWLVLGRMPSSQADWPVQPRPHDKSWGLWRIALSNSVCTREQATLCPGIETRHPHQVLRPMASLSDTPKISKMDHTVQTQHPVPDQETQDQDHQFSTATNLDIHFAHFDTQMPGQRISSTDLPVDAVPVMPTVHG